MQDWSKLTVVQLKEHLKERGLPLSGKKADLVARLQELDKVSLVSVRMSANGP